MPAPRRNRRSLHSAAIILAALVLPGALAAQATAPAPAPRAVRHEDAGADRAAIIAEVRAFYADVHAGRWPNVLDHFLPAKVTARWAPPVATDAWASPEPDAPAPDTARLGSGGESRCVRAGTAAERTLRVAVVDEWARVIAIDAVDCAGGVHDRTGRPGGPSVARDELWLLRVSGRWKIVHLETDAASLPR